MLVISSPPSETEAQAGESAELRVVPDANGCVVACGSAVSDPRQTPAIMHSRAGTPTTSARLLMLPSLYSAIAFSLTPGPLAP